MSTKRETTIKSIVDTSISLFASKGYSATTTALIAQEAGISEAIIFKYFKNKENLLKEISKIAISQIMENISIIPFIKNIEEARNYPLRDFIHSIIKERLTFLDKNYELVKLLVIEMQYSKELKKQTQELVFPQVSEVFNGVKHVLSEKAGITEEKASVILKLIVGLVEFVFIQKYMLGVNLSKDEIYRDTDEFIKLIEKGCGE